MKRNFQKQYFVHFTILFLLVCSQPLMSRHIIGGSMTYTVKPSAIAGNKKIAITMQITRDCNLASGGADFDSPAYFSVFKNTGQSIDSVTSTSGVAISILPIIPMLPPWVPVSNWYCEEVAVYEVLFDLPLLEPGTSYIFNYQRCCKSLSYFTLLTAENSGLTLTTEVSAEAMESGNSSTYFNNVNSVVACVHDSLVFQYPATGTAGDSVVYRFAPLLHGGGPLLTNPGYSTCEGAQPIPPCPPPFDTVPYASENYTFDFPLGKGTSFHLNAATGQISGLPHLVGSYLIGLDADQYRNGEKISTTHVEFALHVIECASNTAEKSADAFPVQVSPNPAIDRIVLKIENQQLINGNYRLKNLNGSEIYSGSFTSGVNEISRNNLPAGVYFLELTADNGAKVIKRVVFQ